MKLRGKLDALKSLWFFDNRYQLLLSRIFFHGTPLNVYVAQGKEILIDHSGGDAAGVRKVITSPMYKQFLPQLDLGTGINVLDIGANGGGLPLLLELNHIRIKKLVCVELNPNTYKRLQFNVARNINCEFVGMNVACCGIARNYQIFLGNGGTSDSLYKENQEAGETIYNIKGMTLDEIYLSTFNKEPGDLCKIDIEGAEYEIFDSPHHISIANFRYLIIEIHSRPQREKIDVIGKIASCGFSQISKDAQGDVFLFHNVRR